MAAGLAGDKGNNYIGSFDYFIRMNIKNVIGDRVIAKLSIT